MHRTEFVKSLIDHDDVVLDIGGRAMPFGRANHLVDISPCPANLKQLEKIWIQQDICDKATPLPFEDKEIDFAVAGHVFEDIRDPVYAVQEMVRVAKRGYIEIPSRYMEQVMGLQDPGVCGFGHHRWIIDTDGDDKIQAIFKSHDLHTSRRPEWHIPKKGDWPCLNRNWGNLGILWEGDISVAETVSLDLDFMHAYYADTVVKAQGIGGLHARMAPPYNGFVNPLIGDGKPHVHRLIGEK